MVEASGSVDAAEVARFARDAARWWDPRGPYAPLFRMEKARVSYVRDTASAEFRRDPREARPLHGLALLDVGCGGGLLAEPLARLGAAVTGIDPAEESIAVAAAHAAEGGLDIAYRAATAETLAGEGASFDVVVASEVIEHVAEPQAFVATLARLVRPGGLLMISTINRTGRAFVAAIVGAEYVLRWLPRGTHAYAKFVRPKELEAMAAAAGLTVIDVTGIVPDLPSLTFRLSSDSAVNYWFAARKPGPATDA